MTKQEEKINELSDLYKQIKVGELELRLSAQLQSKKSVEIELLKIMKRQRDYTETTKSLDIEIEKTKMELSNFKN